jgi:hypothetical protein
VKWRDVVSMIVKVLTMDGMVPDETMLAVWANPMITRLAVGDSFAGEDVCGLVLVCAWPMPSNVKDHVTELCRSSATNFRMRHTSTQHRHCTAPLQRYDHSRMDQ